MLKDIIPAKHRKRVYALVTLAATIFGIWQASNGDWSTFVAAVLAALTTGLATANTNPPTTHNDDGLAALDFIVGVLVGLTIALVLPHLFR